MLLPGNLTSNGHLSGNPESERAERAYFQNFPPDKNNVDELVVVRSDRYTVDQRPFKSFVGSLLEQGAATSVVANAFVYYRNGDRSLVSADRHATLIGIQRSGDVDPLLPIVKQNNGRDGFRVTITGEGTLDHDFNDLSQHDLKSGELGIGLPAALIILLLVFGTVVAGLVPLLMAILAIVVALGLTSIVADAFTLSVFVVNMLTAMGLALGIDYSLFVVSRYREERAAGAAEQEAIATSGATASRAVLFSGSTFVVAMCGMLLVPSNVMRSLAVGAIAVGITSVLAALTLLPALLSLLGDRVNALRVPWIGRNVGTPAGAGEPLLGGDRPTCHAPARHLPGRVHGAAPRRGGPGRRAAPGRERCRHTARQAAQQTGLRGALEGLPAAELEPRPDRRPGERRLGGGQGRHRQAPGRPGR